MNEWLKQNGLILILTILSAFSAGSTLLSNNALKIQKLQSDLTHEIVLREGLSEDVSEMKEDINKKFVDIAGEIVEIRKETNRQSNEQAKTLIRIEGELKNLGERLDDRINR